MNNLRFLGVEVGVAANSDPASEPCNDEENKKKRVIAFAEPKKSSGDFGAFPSGYPFNGGEKKVWKGENRERETEGQIKESGQGLVAQGREKAQTCEINTKTAAGDVAAHLASNSPVFLPENPSRATAQFPFLRRCPPLPQHPPANAHSCFFCRNEKFKNGFL